MREESPASVRQMKKAMARNRPIAMCSNSTGILQGSHPVTCQRWSPCVCVCVCVCYQMKVRPVLASPLVLSVSTMSATGLFSRICTLNTVEKTVMPHSRLGGEGERYIYTYTGGGDAHTLVDGTSTTIT